MIHSEDSVLYQPVSTTAAQVEIHGILGEFDSPEALLGAVKAMRERGYTRLDAYTPFPVHGMDKALGARRSRLGLVSLAGGVLGASAALLLQWWTGAVDYPLVIGGKPFFAFEFSIPVTFELTVLFAAFGTVLGMLAFNGLPRLYHPAFNYSRFQGATDDRFLLAVDAADPKFDSEKTLMLMRSLGAAHLEVVEA